MHVPSLPAHPASSSSPPELSDFTVRRVTGTETEFGVFAPALPQANATWLSALVVNEYAELGAAHAAEGSGTQWDYAAEDPLADARGWRQDRESADPSQLTNEARVLTATGIALSDWEALDSADAADEPQLTMNMVLGNGARLYVDHAHPEYSSPEVLTPLESVRWDCAGDAIAQEIMVSVNRRRLSGEIDADVPEIVLYKNNSDGKNASYGTHENYLVPRSVPFDHIIAGLTPFFATRSVLCGSGRVGIRRDGRTPGFQLSSRADFFEAEVGLETTIRRPIINTRDEPHATSDHYRRLHVIVGDANLLQTSHYVKIGSTSLVIALIERGLAPKLELFDPVRAMHEASHDVSLQAKHRLVDGRWMTALEIQRSYFDAVVQAIPNDADQETLDAMKVWSATLEALDGDHSQAARMVEWVAKKSLLDGYRERAKLAWDDPKLAMIDLQWADLRPEKNLVAKLSNRGLVDSLISSDAISRAAALPPGSTRAYFRGRAVRQYGPNVLGAAWDSMTFQLPQRRRLHRVSLREPLQLNAEQTAELFDLRLSVEDFIDALEDRGA